MSASRPVFELESYDDESLPHGKRLTDEGQLKGHTILAMLMDVSGPLAGGKETVIVTETHCWLVLDSTDDQCYDEKAGIQIDLGSSRWNSTRPEETLQDYLSAEELFDIGVIVASELDFLIEKRNQAKKDEKAKEVASLRQQLAELEGGAE